MHALPFFSVLMSWWRTVIGQIYTEALTDYRPILGPHLSCARLEPKCAVSSQVEALLARNHCSSAVILSSDPCSRHTFSFSNTSNVKHSNMQYCVSYWRGLQCQISSHTFSSSTKKKRGISHEPFTPSSSISQEVM